MSCMADVEKQTITYGGLAKVFTAAVFLVGYAISTFAWVSSIEHKIELSDQEHKIFKAAVTEQLEQLRSSEAESKKAVTDLTITLNRTNAILEQLMKKGQ